MERSCILPNDLLEEILSRLPARHLLRLRCVCKSWCACIDDNRFVKKQYRFQYAVCRADGNVPIFFQKPEYPGYDHARVYLLSKQQESAVVLDLTPDLLRDSAPHFTNDPDFFDKFYCCRGVANGVILFEWRKPVRKFDLEFFDKYLTLWNPATREFQAIPHWPTQQDITVKTCAHIIGFGFDPVSSDLKIVGYINTGVGGHIWQRLNGFEMYSLRSHSWKRLQGLPGSAVVDFSTTDSCLNGVYYWAAQIDGEEPHSGRLVILSFNFSTEVFKVSDPPQYAPACLPDGTDGRMIGLYKDSLAWIVRRNEDLGDQAVCSFDIWVVDKFDDDGYGVPLSWQRVFTIGPIPVVNGLWFRTICMDGDLLLNIQTESAWNKVETSVYNTSMRTFKNLGVGFGPGFRYVESLFRLSMRPAQT